MIYGMAHTFFRQSNINPSGSFPYAIAEPTKGSQWKTTGGSVVRRGTAYNTSANIPRIFSVTYNLAKDIESNDYKRRAEKEKGRRGNVGILENRMSIGSIARPARYRWGRDHVHVEQSCGSHVVPQNVVRLGHGLMFMYIQKYYRTSNDLVLCFTPALDVAKFSEKAVSQIS